VDHLRRALANDVTARELDAIGASVRRLEEALGSTAAPRPAPARPAPISSTTSR
jgi:hypothetical protein